MNIFILSSLKTEIEGLLNFYKPALVCNEKYIKNSKVLYMKNLGENKLFMGITGVGKKNVSRFFKKYFSSLEKVKIDIMISTGFAGAINTRYNIGDIVFAKKIICSDTGKIFTNKIPDFLKIFQKRINFCIGGCVSKVFVKKDKIKLKNTSQSSLNEIDFIDMESCSAIENTRNLHFNCIIVRVISDRLNFKFPDLKMIHNISNKITFFSLFRKLFTEPVNMYRFIVLKRNLLKSQRSLYNILQDILGKIYN